MPRPSHPTLLPVDPPAPRSARARASRALRAPLRFLIDWLPIFTVLFAYDEIHNGLGRFLPGAHTRPQILADQALFGGTVPTLLMQRAFYSARHPEWWDFAALVVYTSHFFVPLLLALALWIRSRPTYLRFTTAFVGMTTLGYLTYVAFPAVPPWLASQHGDLAPTHRLVRELWEYLGRQDVASLFSATNLYANDVAAIPSLHAAYPALMAVFFWADARPPLRALLVAYAATMAVTLVYSAEHYVVDILWGWAYVLVTALVMQRLWPRGARVPRFFGTARVAGEATRHPAWPERAVPGEASERAD